MNELMRRLSWQQVLAAACVCLVIMATAIPMAFVLNYPGYAKDFILQCAVCVLFLVWVAAGISARRPDHTTLADAVRRCLPELLLGAFIVLNFASAAWSGLPYLVLLAAFALGFRIAWGLLVGMVRWEGAWLKAICAVIVAAGFVASAATLILYAAGNPDFDAIVIGHRNFLAGFLIAPVCLAALAMLFGRPAAWARPAWLGLGVVILAPMLYALALCRSNGAVVGLIAAGLFLLGARATKAWRVRLIIALALIAIVATAGVALMWGAIRPRLILSEQATRYFHAIGSLNMIAEKPLAGWGAGAFMSRYPRFRPVEAEQYGWMDQITIHPHNEYVSVAIQTGLAGLALFLGALAVIIRRAARNAPHVHRWLVVGLLAATIGMMVHGLFDIQLSFWGAGTMFWMLIGILLSVGRPAPSSQARGVAAPARLRRAGLDPTGFALLGVAAVVVSAILWEVPVQGLLAENKLARAQEARKAGRYDAAAPLYQLSIAESRYVPDYVLAHAYLGEALAEPVRTGEANGRDALRLEQASRALERARLLAPDLYVLDSDLGQVYLSLARESATTERGAVGDSGSPRVYLMRAAAMLNAQVTVRPYHRSLPRRLLAEALRDLSPAYLPQCIRQLRAALLLDPTDPAAHYLLGRYLAEAGRSAEAAVPPPSAGLRQLAPSTATPSDSPTDE